MTYEEATLEKQKAEKTIMETGCDYKYIIVPSLEADRFNFEKDYDEKTYFDELCKKYSTDNQYIIWQKIDDSSADKLSKR